MVRHQPVELNIAGSNPVGHPATWIKLQIIATILLVMKDIISVIAVVLTFVGYVPYIMDTIKGKTKPHIYSWFLWAFVTFIVFALQVFGKAGVGAFVTLATALLCLTIFLLGMREGQKDITKFDTATFLVSLIAIGIWVFAKQPVVSVILITTINTLANLPTIRKSWKKPYSETLLTWMLGGVRNFLGIVALENYSVLTWLYPVSSLLVNVLFSSMLIIRRKQIDTKQFGKRQTS